MTVSALVLAIVAVAVAAASVVAAKDVSSKKGRQAPLLFALHHLLAGAPDAGGSEKVQRLHHKDATPPASAATAAAASSLGFSVLQLQLVVLLAVHVSPIHDATDVIRGFTEIGGGVGRSGHRDAADADVRRADGDVRERGEGGDEARRRGGEERLGQERGGRLRGFCEGPRGEQPLEAAAGDEAAEDLDVEESARSVSPTHRIPSVSIVFALCLLLVLQDLDDRVSPPRDDLGGQPPAHARDAVRGVGSP
ncbi:hypothetical protein DFJ73DRAFT_842805, partial [Zopfochytrium polystomum]